MFEVKPEVACGAPDFVDREQGSTLFISVGRPETRGPMSCIADIILSATASTLKAAVCGGADAPANGSNGARTEECPKHIRLAKLEVVFRDRIAICLGIARQPVLLLE